MSDFSCSVFEIFEELQTLQRIDIILPVSNMIYLFFSNEFFHGHVPHQNYRRYLPNESCNIHIGILFYFTFSSGFFFPDVLSLSIFSATFVLQELNLIFATIFSNMYLVGVSLIYTDAIS